MKEFRFEGHYYRWTVIDTHTVNGKQYALAAPDIDDETPYILFEADRSRIKNKKFINTLTSQVTWLPFVPSELIIDDEVYDDIIIALEDNGIL